MLLEKLKKSLESAEKRRMILFSKISAFVKQARDAGGAKNFRKFFDKTERENLSSSQKCVFVSDLFLKLKIPYDEVKSWCQETVIYPARTGHPTVI